MPVGSDVWEIEATKEFMEHPNEIAKRYALGKLVLDTYREKKLPVLVIFEEKEKSDDTAVR